MVRISQDPLRDPKITVDRSIYAQWGDVENSSFGTWWGTHWRLFIPADKNRASILHTPEEYFAALKNPECLVVQIPLVDASQVHTVMAAIDAVLKPRGQSPKPKAMFGIDTKRSMNFYGLWAILRLYQFYLENNRDLERAAVSYYKWAIDLNEKLTRPRRVPPPPHADLPPFLKSYVEVLQKAERAGTKRSSPRSRSASGSGSQGYDVLRAQARRYIRQAEKIATNVGRGVFPGKYQ